MSVLSDCADAVVTALNTHSFTPTIAPSRNWDDLTGDLEDSDLHVDVVGVNHQVYELIERGSGDGDGTVSYQSQIAVGIRKKFAQSSQSSAGNVAVAEVDALVELLESIAEFLTEKNIGTTDQFEWEETKFLSSIVHKWLRNANQYTGIVLVTYTHAKSLA